MAVTTTFLPPWHERPGTETTIDDLVERAHAMAGAGRRILGITGAPGAGKSTLCSALVERLDGRAVLVGMDGFHLANTELVRLGRRGRKGAPDTFDVDGFDALLTRLKAQRAGVIYAPTFDRSLEESIGSAQPISADIPLVITEGNYLLHDDDGWSTISDRLDESWYLEVSSDERERRLISRRQSFGEDIVTATSWVHDVDQANGVTVEASRRRAQQIYRITSDT